MSDQDARKQSLAALKPKERGREPGYGRILTPDQEAHIRQLIMDKPPSS